MLLSLIWATISLIVDLTQTTNFSWLSASSAVMVSGSILFERLKPGTGLDGGINIASLPKLGQAIHPFDKWLMKNGGKLSISALVFGTLIWAYGSCFT